jgi:hypothetical protein
VKAILVKFTLAVVLAGFFAACAGAPSTPPANQADDNIVQAGSFAGEGKIYLPLRFPNDNR